MPARTARGTEIPGREDASARSGGGATNPGVFCCRVAEWPPRTQLEIQISGRFGNVSGVIGMLNGSLTVFNRTNIELRAKCTFPRNEFAVHPLFSSALIFGSFSCVWASLGSSATESDGCYAAISIFLI